MRSIFFLTLAIVGMSSSAYAESFLCQGTGKFVQIGTVRRAFATTRFVWPLIKELPTESLAHETIHRDTSVIDLHLQGVVWLHELIASTIQYRAG